MKRYLAWILSVLLLVSVLAGCGGSKPETPAPTEAPTAAPAPAATQAPASKPDEPAPTQPPYQPYEYAYGSMMIGVPNSLPPEPLDEGTSVLFTDPEALWTVRFQPIGVQETGLRAKNFANLMDNFRTMGNYQNIETKEVTIGGHTRRIKVKGKKDLDLSKLPKRVEPPCTISDDKLKELFPEGWKELPDEIHKHVEYEPAKYIYV